MIVKQLFLKFEAAKRGGHTHVTVRCDMGVPEQRPPALAKAGDLIFRNEEWELIKLVLLSSQLGRSIEFVDL